VRGGHEGEEGTMAKVRKKAAKRTTKKAKRGKPAARGRAGSKLKPARRAKSKRQGVIAGVLDAVQETGALRRRLAGRETFED
jgi:hypothetical protein